MASLGATLKDSDFLAGLVFGGLAFAVIHSVHLVLFRAAVRRHEHDQLFVSLVESAVPPAPAKALLDKFELRWSDRARGDLALSAVGWLLPFMSFVLMPIMLAGRLRGQLEQHEQHEQEAEELAALYRRAVADKAAQAGLVDDDLSEIPGPPVGKDAEVEDPVLDLES